MNSQRPQPTAGEKLAHYKVIGPLAAGGMGAIYTAEDTRLGRRVALKVLKADAIANEDQLQRFQVEARAVAAMNHPGIVTIHGVESDRGIHFIAMELVEGRTLGEVIPPGGLPLRDFFRIAEQLTAAVAVAHQSGITHRDLKPDNIMVTPSGSVKVLDFGLAKLVDEPAPPSRSDGSAFDTERIASPRLTEDGDVLGTVPYMSPEHVTKRDIGHHSDIFSLGIILHEMLTGVRPFQGATLGATLSSILHDDPEPVRRQRQDVPRSIELAIEFCLEKSPAVRMQHASALHEQLRISRREIESSPGGLDQRELQSLVSSRADKGVLARTGSLALRHRRSLLLLAVIALVNYVETAVETAARESNGYGVELGYELARAAHWFEGETKVEGYESAGMVVVYGYSVAYFFALVGLVLGTGWALARASSRTPFRVFSVAVAANYLISLPFFLFFPVPERWAYPDSGAVLLSDLWAPELIDIFRPFSGLDNCFPSFHVSLTVVMIGLAFLYKLQFRWSALWIGILIIISTSVLGIHWVTDITAGLATGLIALQAARLIVGDKLVGPLALR